MLQWTMGAVGQSGSDAAIQRCREWVVRPVYAKRSGCRGDYLGGADSRAGGSGAGLQARIAGLVEGSKVPRKPIGAAARVREGLSSSSPAVQSWGEGSSFSARQ